MNTRDDIAKRIELLHVGILSSTKATVRKALGIGLLLAQQKLRLAHGQFESWLELNVSFSARTARRYLELDRNRATVEAALKTATVSDLNDAYRLVHDHSQVADEDVPDAPPVPITKAGDHKAKAGRLNKRFASLVDCVLTLREDRDTWTLAEPGLRAQIARLLEVLDGS